MERPSFRSYFAVLFLLHFVLSGLLGQSRISGFVYKEYNKYPLHRAEVRIPELGLNTLTDRAGFFYFKDLPQGVYFLEVSQVAFRPQRIKIVIDEKRENVENVYLTYEPEQIFEGKIPLDAAKVQINGELIGRESNWQHTSPDPLDKIAALELNRYGFNRKGLSTDQEVKLFNDLSLLPTNTANSLTDFFTQLEENKAQAEMGKKRIGSTGGVYHLYSTPYHSPRSKLLFSYGLGQQDFTNRYGLLYNTGLSKKGWAVQAFGSRVSASEAQFEESTQDAWTAMLGIQKHTKKHALELNFLFNHREDDLAAISTEEVYRLRSKEYNPNWGFRDGNIRKIGQYALKEYLLQAGHTWRIDSSKSMRTTIGLLWYQADLNRIHAYQGQDVSPEFYRNRPSFLAFQGASPSDIADKTLAWQVDPSVYQLDWDALASANEVSPSFAEVADQKDDINWEWNSWYFDDDFIQGNLSLGVHYQGKMEKRKAKIVDLLGGDHYLNGEDYSGGFGAYDIDNPNQNLQQGDAFQYNYQISMQEANIMAGYRKTLKNWNYGFGADWGIRTLRREGLFRHYLFPNNSDGKSELRYDYQSKIKAQLALSIGKGHEISYQTFWWNRPPDPSLAYPLVEISDLESEGLRQSSSWFHAFQYSVKQRNWQLGVQPYFQYRWQATDGHKITYDQNPLASQSRVFRGIELLRNLETRHLGAELYFTYQKSFHWQFSGAWFYGDHRYANDPTLTLYSTEFLGNEGKMELGSVDLSNLHIPGYAQQSGHFSIRYTHRNEWFIRLAANVLMDHYTKPSYSRYSTSFLVDPQTGNTFATLDRAVLTELRTQSKIPVYWVFNLTASKTYDFRWFQLGLFFGVFNLFDQSESMILQQSSVFRRYDSASQAFHNAPGLLDGFSGQGLGRHVALRAFMRF